jgi:hypothetical protein
VKGELYFFKCQRIIFLIQLDSLCFFEFKNIAHSVYLNVSSESPNYFQPRISIAIQRGNAASVLGTVAKSSGFEEVFYLFKI